MHRIRYSFRSCLCALFVVVGCGSNQIQTGTNNPPVTNPPDPPSSTTPSSVTESSVYVVGSSVLVFPQTAKGATKATLEIPGAQVSVDEAGNVYVFTGSAINEYLATALNGPPYSFLIGPVPGTAVSNVQDVMANFNRRDICFEQRWGCSFQPDRHRKRQPIPEHPGTSGTNRSRHLCL